MTLGFFSIAILVTKLFRMNMCFKNRQVLQVFGPGSIVINGGSEMGAPFLMAFKINGLRFGVKL